MVIKMPANWVLGYMSLVYVPISSFCDLWKLNFYGYTNFSCLDASVCAGLVYFSFALGTAIPKKNIFFLWV